ncbi:MAG: hypothetical protein L0227_09785 [Chloroflexi bacterium]|nr:hypothetical protein [Chloroflexota bacterium]
MTTATINQGPPTEAEIRQALEERLAEGMDPPRDIWDIVAPILDSKYVIGKGWLEEGFTPPVDHPGTLWANLRPTEAAELDGAVNEAVDRALARFGRQVVDDVVAVAVRFAEAHPEAPRGTWPEPPRIAIQVEADAARTAAGG